MIASILLVLVASVHFPQEKLIEFDKFYLVEGATEMVEDQNPSGDLRYNYTISIQEAYEGKVADLQFVDNSGSRRELVNIPKGIEDGSKIRFRGYGEVGSSSGTKGDLYVFVTVEKDELYKVDGFDLRVTLLLSSSKLENGATFPLNHPSGSDLSISIVPGTKSGTVILVEGRGMPVLHSEKYGNLYVTVTAAEGE